MAEQVANPPTRFVDMPESAQWALTVLHAAYRAKGRDILAESGWTAGDPIKLTAAVNGVEVDFTVVVDRLVAGIDRLVEKAAAELVLARAAEFDRALSELSRSVLAHAREERRRLFPGVEFSDED